MERIIKFRFWNGERMLEDHEGWTEGIGINFALKCSADYGYKIMQFTGLKDKNGKEIYEGDIYTSWYSRDTSGEDIVAIIDVVKFEVEEHREKAGVEIPFLKNAEVIGNIYENPELLKG